MEKYETNILKILRVNNELKDILYDGNNDAKNGLLLNAQEAKFLLESIKYIEETPKIVEELKNEVVILNRIIKELHIIISYKNIDDNKLDIDKINKIFENNIKKLSEEEGNE